MQATNGPAVKSQAMMCEKVSSLIFDKTFCQYKDVIETISKYQTFVLIFDPLIDRVINFDCNTNKNDIFTRNHKRNHKNKSFKKILFTHFIHSSTLIN